MLGKIHRGMTKLYAETGEVRCPKTGEHYVGTFSVCYAAVDFDTVAYPIVREVVVDVPATYKFKE